MKYLLGFQDSEVILLEDWRKVRLKIGINYYFYFLDILSVTYFN